MSDEVATPSFCAQCRSRCGLRCHRRDGRLLRIEPLPEHPSGASFAPRGWRPPELIYHPDRLTRPLRRTTPKGSEQPVWGPISWDEALAEIARRMMGIRGEHGAEQVAFSVTTPSGTHISDAIAWIERLIRCFGSPNTIYATEICNWHKDFASPLHLRPQHWYPRLCALGLHRSCGATTRRRPGSPARRDPEGDQARRAAPRHRSAADRRLRGARTAGCRCGPEPTRWSRSGSAHLMIGRGLRRHFAGRWTNGPLLVRADTGRFLRETDLFPGAARRSCLRASERDEPAAI